MISLPFNWTPREYQGPVWKFLEHGGKRACLVWHRRSGKDDVGLHWAAVSAMTRAGNYWHLLPAAEQARKRFGAPSMRTRANAASIWHFRWRSGNKLAMWK